ncbi:hypothetical protein ACFTZJ_22015 [Streptomyces globisporus]|uniref:hypothetical protein n=1 Tax=Streptomyces globisporus TaxID=1908 RepID=UPI00363C9293
MALIDLFTRKPATAATAPPAETPDLKLGPEIGETWKPEGLPVAERYYNQAHAVVLVASTGPDPYGTAYYLVACLGCHFLSTRTKYESFYIRYALGQAAEAANNHAGTCRALPRELPARPDEDTARELLRSWVMAMPRRDLHRDVDLDLAEFDSGRLKLQRTNEWIRTELEAFAAERRPLTGPRTTRPHRPLPSGGHSCSRPARAAGSAARARSVPAPATRCPSSASLVPGAGDAPHPHAPARGGTGAAQRRAPANWSSRGFLETYRGRIRASTQVSTLYRANQRAHEVLALTGRFRELSRELARERGNPEVARQPIHASPCRCRSNPAAENSSSSELATTPNRRSA